MLNYHVAIGIVLNDKNHSRLPAMTSENSILIVIARSIEEF